VCGGEGECGEERVGQRKLGLEEVGGDGGFYGPGGSLSDAGV